MAELFKIGTTKSWVAQTGDTKEWEIDLDSIGGYLEVKVSGSTSGTDVTVALTPNFYSGNADSRVFPDTRTGTASCKGTSTNASIIISTISFSPIPNNVPDFYLPIGHWKLFLTANHASSTKTTVSSTPLTEIVYPPAKPDGPQTVLINVAETYKIGGAVDNLGYAVEYQIDWGDGATTPDLSSWIAEATANAGVSHTFTASGNFNVRATARSTHSNAIISGWGLTLVVNVGIVSETVSNPQTPSGPTTGIKNTTLTYSTGGSVITPGGSDIVEYSMDWGDSSTPSSFSTTPTFTHSFTTEGTYLIIATARIQGTTTTAVSNPLQVVIGAIGETITAPVLVSSNPTYSTPSPVQATFISNPTDSVNPSGDPLEYQFSFGDGTFSSWITPSNLPPAPTPTPTPGPTPTPTPTPTPAPGPTSPPVINAFTANPATIATSGSSVLSWSITGATSASINNGIGNLSSLTSGTISVSPSATTTYTLTTTNTGGTTTATATVTLQATNINWLVLTRIGTTDFFGYDPGEGGVYFQALANKTYYFLIDPSLSTTPGSPDLIATSSSYYTGTFTLYILNADNSLGAIIPPSGGDWWLGSKFVAGLWHGERLLLRFDSISGCSSLYIYWCMH